MTVAGQADCNIGATKAQTLVKARSGAVHARTTAESTCIEDADGSEANATAAAVAFAGAFGAAPPLA